MSKIDLDEIEASLGYLEDWKKVIAELKAARKVVEAARVASKVINNHYLKEAPHDEGLWFARDEIGTALKKLDEATNGDGEK